MPEVDLDIPRIWVEFTDPANEGQRFRCDLTWLTSSWTCIFGSGCQGIYADRPDDGCCTLGAHFTDKDDVERVRAVANQLGEDEWEHHPGPDAFDDAGNLKNKAWTEKEDGVRKTKVVDGACIFLNRTGFPAGAGCALHQHAILTGQQPHTVKPDVCWQLPIRRSYRTVEVPDGSSYLETTITEYDRRGWGAGGHDLDWYCSGNSEAHVSREPVFRSNAGELIELMGEQAYAALVVRCEAHLAAVKGAQTVRSRKMLPLLVHPATLAAGGPGKGVRTTRKTPAKKSPTTKVRGKPGGSDT